ncbi:MAG: CRTAC1 family protein, partial [Chloroflexi bacterium]|nr:CRTAC1 family protein [Chloroflexota bacterium]
ALWLDVDTDGDGDLLVGTEFGPVRLFVNEDGRLADATSQSGLDQWTGLWTGIAAGDFNEDGHMDFAAANLGLNTKFTASPEYPTVVYAGNIDGDGDVDIIEAEYVDGVLRPIRERGATGAEMPFILEKFDTFRAYAEASLDKIYGDRLDEAQMFEANTLAHSVFINDGNGRFTAAPLPQLAQITTGYGLTTADFDNDGHDDLYLVGNFSYAEHETRQHTGGVSYWLRGVGDGSFVVVPSSVSGLFVPYDGRGTAVSDYDNDGWVDVVVGVNNRHPLLFHNRGNAQNCALRIRLNGGDANPRGIGSRIIVTLPDGTTTTREIHAGGGYFSQDGGTHLFGLGQVNVADVQIIWPDGSVSETTGQPCGEVTVSKK